LVLAVTDTIGINRCLILSVFIGDSYQDLRNDGGHMNRDCDGSHKKIMINASTMKRVLVAYEYLQGY